MAKEKYQVGQIVFLQCYSRYGVIVRIDEDGPRRFAKMRYVDTSTGELMVCPDSRCRENADWWLHCPICGCGVRLANKPERRPPYHKPPEASDERLPIMEPESIRLYLDEGMLSQELADRALSLAGIPA